MTDNVWQPIEMPPKDSALVLLLDDRTGVVALARFAGGVWRRTASMAAAESQSIYAPTKWAPVPAVPVPSVETAKSDSGFPQGSRPLCPFCSTPWTDDMVRVFDIDARHGYGSYDFGPEDQRATVDITCSSCERLIYRKEYDNADAGY